MFLETSEEKASPEKLREMLTVFKDKGSFFSDSRVNCRKTPK
ncbi:hypothetical protein TMUPMC115_2630 [Tetragenococcus muriaticus PMC-11-5]|uniref:Uncharacterized protein n=1 Tax=Tetragenococcus muriaticus PMC-11-5 TaxID=1302649 RepID=A0A091BX13_9ENTE|nr:hypothetical protein TMUPMC115_2630 [Tetragenococcus muriaticus PMC-11-5]